MSDLRGIWCYRKTSDIHENNTVEKLEKYVMLAPKLRTYEKREVYPLTGSQKGIFAECSKNPESTVYNIPFLFELDPAVDTRKLSDAIARMVSAIPTCSHRYILTIMGRWYSALEMRHLRRK